LNFHAFGGDARYESDFTADNIANIMLLRAYGLNITVKGREPSVETQQKIRDLFAINRCNRLFVERAERRQEQQSELGSFQERMWHFKRQLANQLSVALVIQGAAVSDIAVYFTGRIRTRTEDKRGSHYHDGKVVVRVNGIYIETGLAPYLEDHRNKQTAAERLKAINERRTQRLDDIVTFCKTAYLKELKAHSWLREYAQSTLNALEHRLQA